jgi:hypothetical protein
MKLSFGKIIWELTFLFGLYNEKLFFDEKKLFPSLGIIKITRIGSLKYYVNKC